MTGPFPSAWQAGLDGSRADRRAERLRNLDLCPRCRNRPYDRALWGKENEGHVCGECWKDDRNAEEAAISSGERT